MSKTKIAARIDSQCVEVKSKFDAEFRRFSINRSHSSKYEEFKSLVERLHRLSDTAFLVSYTDPRDGDLLPINNDDNLGRALQTARPLLRVIIQRKGDSLEELNGYGTMRPKNIISSILGGTPGKAKSLAISNPHDFRQVSAIIDVDIVPETCRRVRLLKHGSDKPLGFYIRDGTSVRVSASGVERQPGVFVSRLVPGGLAEGTGLLAVGDEVLEVNGIEVAGKTLDQVTDMMVANSSNLIITVKPANQRAVLSHVGATSTIGSNAGSQNTGMASSQSMLLQPRRASLSQASSHSHHSHPSSGDDPDDRFDQDEIVDLTGLVLEDSGGVDQNGEGGSLYQHSSIGRRSLHSATDDGQVLHL